MSYTTINNRLQITTQDGQNPAERIHEDAGDETPVCNIELRPYKGQPVTFTSRAPAKLPAVTASGRCLAREGLALSDGNLSVRAPAQRPSLHDGTTGEAA